jgi:acyl-CoA thioester hydrolase
MSLSSHQHTIRVYYEDTDAGGIVYYANYLKFFERARTEWLRELGINQSIFLEQNIGFVVTKVSMDNKASAKLDDLLTITTTISRLKSASLVFSQQLVDQNQITLCTAEIKVACVNLALAKPKPCTIPKSILGALKRVS